MALERRGFLKMFAGAAAAAAVAPLIPFGRVWSFPSKIVIPELSIDQMRDRFLEPAGVQFVNQVDANFLPLLERWYFNQKTREITREQLVQQRVDGRDFVMIDKMTWPGDRVPVLAMKTPSGAWRFLDEPAPEKLILDPTRAKVVL